MASTWLGTGVRLWALGVGLLVLAGCPETVCTMPDAGCPPPPDGCTDARAGFTCTVQGLSCGCCVGGATHCDLLGCDLQADGGLAWYSYSGVPPPVCQQ